MVTSDSANQKNIKNSESSSEKITRIAVAREQVLKDKTFLGKIRRIFRYNSVSRDEWVVEQAKKVPKESKVLDVGAGFGPYRKLFNHCEYYAQDFGLVPSTQGEYTQLDYVCDVTSIPVDNNSFDVVICTEVLEHLPEPIKAIKEISRILRPGGIVLLTSPLGSLLHQQPYHFYGGYTPFWYEEFLPRYDLDVRSIERNRGFFSLFSQEGSRFSSYISPRKLFHKPLLLLALAPLWIVTLPLFKFLLPIIAAPLDCLGLEDLSTAGYHVVACKREV